MKQRRWLAAIVLWLAFVAAPREAWAVSSGGCLPTSGVINGVQNAQNINAGFAAVLSSNAGSAAPTNYCGGVPPLGQFWLDTSGTYPIWKMYDGTQWDAVFSIDKTNNQVMRGIGGGLGTMTAAATTDICNSMPQALISIGGATAISSFGSTCKPGVIKTLTFDGGAPLVPGSILLPTNAMIYTSPGDRAVVVAVGAGVWNVLAYTKADGSALAAQPAHYAGQVLLMRSTTCPAGALLEDGSEFSRTTYPQLFAAIGTAFGSGNGSTTANLPDSRGQFDRGWGSGQSVDAGRTFGATQAWLVGAHNHTFSTQASLPFSTSFSVSYHYQVPDIDNGTSGSGYGRVQGTHFNNDSATGTLSGSAKGPVSGTTDGNVGAENRPTNITAYHCIFTNNVP